MTNKEYVLRHLRNGRGDDLERCRKAFAQYTPEELNEPHGESGVLRRDLLRRYEEQRAQHEAAVAWVESL